MEQTFDPTGENRQAPETTQYPPLPYRPLRARGVLGVTWELFKRGFFPMLGFTAVIWFLPSILYGAMSMTSTYSSLGYMNGYMAPADLENMLTSMAGMMGGSFLFSVLQMFLLGPMTTSTMFLEMRQRMLGRRGSFKDLFRYAVPAGFKRLYTTQLALLVVSIGIGIVIGIVVIIFVTVFAASIVMSVMQNSMPNIAGIILAFLAIFAIAVVAELFPMLALPAAVHENTRGFKPIGRSFSLVGRHFFRALGLFLLFTLILLGIIVVLVIIAVLLGVTGAVSPFVLFIPIMIASLAMLPLSAAFGTALYVDLSARDAARQSGGDDAPEAPASVYDTPREQI